MENIALAKAMSAYAQRTNQDDFSSVTSFLELFPASPWRASLLSGLGLEYYNTAHYSKALATWQEAWTSAKDATDLRAKAMADRAAGELAFMYGRLGLMQELEALLKSVEGRVFVGAATEKISGAREGLWNMRNRPDIAFRCGPLALLRIQAAESTNLATLAVSETASTAKGLSLTQVAELSRKIGLNYQMAYREKSGDFVVPSVVHWKVGHYAALVRREGNKYLLQDPTFLNDVCATGEALAAETSGYFLIRAGPLPKGWRAVDAREGQSIWGKGNTQGKDPRNTGPPDPRTLSCPNSGSPGESVGMASPSVHLMLVSLNLTDTPVGYSPPIGPPVEFTVRYNHREAFQPAVFTYGNFGAKWTSDWISYITDNPQNASADVNYYVRGSGTRTFNAFNPNTQTYRFQQYDQTQLKRTGPANYELLARDGSKLVFGQSDGSVGTSRKVFLSQVIDPQGNVVTLNYDGNLRLTNMVDAIGQATTLTYSTNDIYKIIRVTDPFGRFATFDYDHLGRLTNITDVIGISSRFVYEDSGDYINALITPYGTNTFVRGEVDTTRWLETTYPDGSRERVEFNQGTTLGVPFSDPASTVPQGMNTGNSYLWFRNTYYWNRNACASSYGDYSKAKVYHWLHTEDLAITAGVLESTREALEGRVWYDYAGQSASIVVGANNRPTHVGRVLDDGSTQLHTYGYNDFGNVISTIDPIGRTFSYSYDTNGIDLLEVRMTRAGKNELVYKAVYNAQHRPLITAGANGQFTTNTYNVRGQLLSTTNPKGETTSYSYTTNGYLIAADGPLPGTNDTLTATYDAFGRVRTKTDESGYTVTLDYDALNRITKITYPDASFQQFTYYRLNPSIIQDRAGRQTLLEYNAAGNLAKRTDPLGRVIQFQWCNCGNVKSLTDPMGRTTEWQMDVQGRLVAKQYGDGSKVTYAYESASGRVRQIIDEKFQIKQFVYNKDNTIRAINYLNAAVPTPSVSFTYDADYLRRSSMSDGIGNTLYAYAPITASPTPGAGQLASVDGPLTNDTITYTYDELGRRIAVAVNGVSRWLGYDVADRVASETNALGTFGLVYDGASRRVSAELYPNGRTRTNTFGDIEHDRALQRMTYKVGSNPIYDFILGWDIGKRRITSWAQQFGAEAPSLWAFDYDAMDQLTSATLTNAGTLINTFGYDYDLAGNRLMEIASGVTNSVTYNALNQISTSTAPSGGRTNEWDAEDRLAAVTVGNQRVEFSFDGESRLSKIRFLTNNVEVTSRRLLWCDNAICEERDSSGAVVKKRFFDQGVVLETGTNSGSFYYVRDHLGSVHAMTDSSGTVRSRYSYDPYGRRTYLSGDVEADFGFATMFDVKEAALSLTKYRAYEPAYGRWLSRDPLPNAELKETVNLYAYVKNNPVNLVDPLGLESSASGCCKREADEASRFDLLASEECRKASLLYQVECQQAWSIPGAGQYLCDQARQRAEAICQSQYSIADLYHKILEDCQKKSCSPGADCSTGKRPPKRRILPGGLSLEEPQ